MQLELPDLREAIIAHDSFDKPAIIVMGGNGIGRRSRHAELTPQSDKRRRRGRGWQTDSGLDPLIALPETAGC
jgi:hypothetical protein